MKILFIHTFYSPDMVGGAEVVVQSLAEGLTERGIDVAILTTTDKPGLHQDEVNGVRVWRAGLRNLYWHKYNQRPGIIQRRLWHLLDVYNPLMAQMVKKVVLLEKPTLASVHNLPGFSVATWSALKDAGVPIVQVLHDHYLLCPAATMYRNKKNCIGQCSSCKIMRTPHKAISQSVSGVVGVSNYILNRHLEAGYFSGVKNIQVIYNTRTAQELCIYGNTREPDGSQPLRFGFIGALNPVKGIELLLKTYINNFFPGTELLVAGVGDTKYVDNLKLSVAGHAVRFLGRVKPADFYQLVDVVIVPSLWNEPLGTVIMEAMIFGKTVVASNTGGSPEMVIDGENGLLFNPGDPNGLLEAMARAYTSQETRSRLAEGARRCVRFMDREHFLDQHILLYTDVENYD